MKFKIPIAVLVPALSAFAAGAPTVCKVEPPDWVAKPGGDRVRLLLTGQNLRGAVVSIQGLSASVLPKESGETHLFVDITVPGGARLGGYPLSVTTPDGQARATFALVTPVSRYKRFQGFSSDDFIYEIMVDRFANGDPSNDVPPKTDPRLFNRSEGRYYHGGDFQGIIERLPYIQGQGATAVWLTPIYQNTQQLNWEQREKGRPVTDYHGYGIVDFYGVEEHFGGLEKFIELVDKAHAIGLKVILDNIANHTSPYHPWKLDPPTPKWLNVPSNAACGSRPENFATLISPHAPQQQKDCTLATWFGGKLPDLNQDDENVAQYLIQNTLWWIGKTGIDGIREDTVPYVPIGFWHSWTSAIKSRYPAFRVVGEVYNDSPTIVSYFQGGQKRYGGSDSGLDSLFDYPLYAKIVRAFGQQKPLAELRDVLDQDELYTDPNRLVTFVGNHDTTRFMSFTGTNRRRLKAALAIVMTSCGIPMVYYGDEIGMTGWRDDPDKRRDFPGGWAGDRHNAFDAPSATERDLQDWVRLLARLRAENEPLRRGTMTTLLAAQQTYAFARETGAGAVVAVFNSSPGPNIIRLPLTGMKTKPGIITDLIGHTSPSDLDVVTIKVYPDVASGVAIFQVSGTEQRPR